MKTTLGPPKPLLSTVISLSGSRHVSCGLLVIFVLRFPGIFNSTVPDTPPGLLPTPNLLVCCVSCLRAWHWGPTGHLRALPFLTYSPASPAFIPIPDFGWFCFVISLSNLLSSLDSESHILTGIILLVIQYLAPASVCSPSIISLHHCAVIYIFKCLLNNKMQLTLDQHVWMAQVHCHVNFFFNNYRGKFFGDLQFEKPFSFLYLSLL